MPLDRTSRIGFIGAGRLGASLAVAASLAGCNVTSVHRRDRDAANAVAARIPGAIAARTAQAVADACEVVFVTTGDASIKEAADGIDWTNPSAVVHCSGATPVSALQSAADAGLATGGFHPMQTFPTEHREDRFSGITIAIEAADPQLRGWLSDLATALGARHFELQAHQRPAYHASAVMACGLVAGLAGLAAEMWREMGLSREDGLAALAPLVKATAEQIADIGIPAAITGPYVRGDALTVQAHLDATRARGRDIARGYAALALAQLPIAREQGNISGENYATIEAMLREALNSRS